MNENKDTVDKNCENRRSFLKKAVYAAPTLVAMGTLISPQNAEAEPPPGPSNPWPANVSLNGRRESN